MAESSGEPASTTASPADPDPAQREAKATVAAKNVAIAALVLSIISAGIGGVSVYIARQQNTNAQRQELVTLVTDIAQGQQGSGTGNGNAINPELTQLGEAEEANTIITSLPPGDVSSVERYLVALGLEDGEDYTPALLLLRAAAREDSDPRTAADAWRAAAAADYAIGSDSEAESYIIKAEGVFKKQDADQESNIAYTDLFDAKFRADIPDCSTANSEWGQAAQLTEHDHNLLANNNARTARANAMTALIDKCHADPGQLAKVYVTGPASPQS